MEDVIAVEEPVVNNSRAYLLENQDKMGSNLLENQDKMGSEISVEANATVKTLTNAPSEKNYCGPSNLNFLVLEVRFSACEFSRKIFLVFIIFSPTLCCRSLKSTELLIYHMFSPLIRCLLDMHQNSED